MILFDYICKFTTIEVVNLDAGGKFCNFAKKIMIYGTSE